MPSYQQNTGEILANGEYEFKVQNAKELTSSKGSDMIELTLKIKDSGALVYDNLVFVQGAYWKIDQFRIATGETLGKAGTEFSLAADDCVGRTGLCELFIDEYEGREKNKVANYLFPSRAKPKSPVPAGTKPANNEPDDIPF